MHMSHDQPDLFLFEGRQIRFTSTLSEDTRLFESELSEHVELPLEQRQVYLNSSSREFRLLQVRAPDGRAATQAVIFIHRSSRFASFAKGIIPKLACSTSPVEELFALRILLRICEERNELMTLRLQPLRDGSEALSAFVSSARLSGFAPCLPASYTRTLKFDLNSTVDNLTARLSGKTRAKIKDKRRDNILLTELTEPRFIPQCRAALAASFLRTGGNPNDFDFEAAFKIARLHPNRARILGIFLPHRPDELLAFVVGFYGGGSMAEYVAAGSLADPFLRRLPFNYFLFWELVLWAHAAGARWLDMGGITPGDPDDPRANISRFKRHFSDNETEVGSEMLVKLNPVKAWIFNQTVRLYQVLRTRMAIP